MPIPDLVLIHGGSHAADCWDPVIGTLSRAAPGLRVLAVDLPGHRAKPGDLRTATIRDWVDSVVSDVDRAGLRRVVVAGHSMAGLIMPGVVSKLGATRVAEAVFVTTCVPPQGSDMAHVLGPPITQFVRMGARFGMSLKLPAVATFMCCNGMTRAQRQFVKSRLYPESTAIIAETVSRRDMPEGISRTWVMTLRDRVFSEAKQRSSIDALGGVDRIYSIDTCHDAMVSEPERLAEILLERCATQASD